MKFADFFLSDRQGSKPPSLATTALNFLLAVILLTGIFCLAFSQIGYQWNWAATYKYHALFIQGWIATIFISLAALVVSGLVGLLAAFARRSRVTLVRALAAIYVELIRGTPLLVQILVFFYVLAEALRVENRWVVGVLTLSAFHGAYISEIIRSGIESVGRSQLESARAVGFTSAQIYRYIIFPQALRQMLPPLAGQFASLVKDSSLLSIIAIAELTYSAKEVNAHTVSEFECYVPVAVGYLLLTFPISLWTRRLEARNRYET